MIDKNTLFRLFSEKDEKFNVSLIRRSSEKEALKYLDYKEILAIMGVRRSGKTYIMYSLMQHLSKNNIPKENILYLNFEDERLAFIKPEDLENIYEWYLEFSKAEGKLYFFLDEIQNVPLWEKWLSRSYEKIKFIISGSNSTMLSSEIATAISGRYVEITMYPFSFREYVSYKDHNLIENLHKSESLARLSNLFNEYIEFGGFPEVLIYKKRDLLQEYFKTIMLRDVMARHNIKYKDYVEKLLLYLMSNLGKPVSLYKLDKENPIGINTIKNYLNFIEKGFLLFFVNKFDYSIKKQHANPRKVYGIDTALARDVSFRFSEDQGRIFENIVFLELIRAGEEVYYYNGKHECDFLIKKGLKITGAIQVCFRLDEENKEREINGLLEALDKFKLKKGTIITSDKEFEEDILGKKIQYISLLKWLIIR
jgi:uncharacterized protein